jgi:Pyruvate/2-oxoacid:ferredoxin oxidoreductase gamma subunit
VARPRIFTIATDVLETLTRQWRRPAREAMRVERELLMTGIGGQGVQLAAELLARSAITEGRHVQLFGSYGGMMRGGNTDATLIVGDAAVQAPPMVGSAWSALVMHPAYAAGVPEKVRAGGVLLINTSIPGGEAEVGVHADVVVLPVPASDIAIGLGAAAAASMVAIGAYAAATGLVSLDALVDGVPDVLPSYRRQHARSSQDALRAGADAVRDLPPVPQAWAVMEAAR